MSGPGTAVVLVAAEDHDRSLLGTLAQALRCRLGRSVVASLSELDASLAALAEAGVQRIAVVFLLPPNAAQRAQLDTAIGEAMRRWPALAIHVPATIVDLLVSHCQAACQRDPVTSIDMQLADLDREINALLPPEYQGRYEEVSSESMGTAPLRFDRHGKVLWDQMWTTFCDLALAGGPAHRGTLLEAVTAAEALAEPAKYQAVVAEIERGIRLVTGLPVVPSPVPGWVGVRCDSEEMAIWLMRAIIVENVMVRRESDVLFLPAGPRFTLKREIKNVVTAMAKTCHYWSAHLMARRRASEPQP